MEALPPDPPQTLTCTRREAFPSLAPFVVEFPAAQGRPAAVSLDFRDPAAMRELTRVLLKVDFGIDWWIPDGQVTSGAGCLSRDERGEPCAPFSLPLR